MFPTYEIYPEAFSVDNDFGEEQWFGCSFCTLLPGLHVPSSEYEYYSLSGTSPSACPWSEKSLFKMASSSSGPLYLQISRQDSVFPQGIPFPLLIGFSVLGKASYRGVQEHRHSDKRASQCRICLNTTESVWLATLGRLSRAMTLGISGRYQRDADWYQLPYYLPSGSGVVDTYQHPFDAREIPSI